MKAVIIVCGLAALLCVAAPGHAASSQIQSEAPHWCDFARQDLKTSKHATFDCETQGNRCIRMNNYSCTKNASSTSYEGQIVDAAGKPVTDVDHHVLYEDPKWSLKKSINVLRTYYTKKGLKSALAIAETWAPWCDTNGSKVTHLGWGRTCTDGPGPAPKTFTGPRCSRPSSGIPLKGQCGPCNCPNEMADFYVKDSGIGVSADLHLFDDQGRPTAALNPVLKRVVWMELGFQASEDFINNAVAVYKP
jgi:hypothetical protein